jgi:hypothetical protein
MQKNDGRRPQGRARSHKGQKKRVGNRLDKVKEIIKDGNDRARAIARETMMQVREAVKI